MCSNSPSTIKDDFVYRLAVQDSNSFFQCQWAYCLTDTHSASSMNLIFVSKSGEMVPSHQAILLPRSSHLTTLVENSKSCGCAEDVPTLLLPGWDKEAIQAMIQLLYSGSVIANYKTLNELIKLMNELRFEIHRDKLVVTPEVHTPTSSLRKTVILETGEKNPKILKTGEKNTEIMETGERNPEIMETGERNTEILETGERNTEILETGERKSEILETGERKSEILETHEINPVFSETDESSKKSDSTRQKDDIITKIKAKIQEFTSIIATSAHNLEGQIKQAENMKHDLNVLPEEVEERISEVENYKRNHTELEINLNLKIKQLKYHLKIKTAGEQEMTDEDVCEILEETQYQNKEVRFAETRVLKATDDESDSDTDQATDQPIDYGPPTVLREAQRNITKPITIPQGDQRMCTKCNKLFKNVKIYKEHKKEHLQNEFFSCKSCTKVFSNAATLTSHQKSHDDISRMKKCGLCSFKTKKSQHLLMHTRSVHTKEKLFPCNWCEQAFSVHVSLEAHLKKHQDKTKMQCRQCRRFHKKKINHVCN